MALVGFNYECECTSNREQSTTLFSFSPQVFSITWPKKNKNKYFLFQTIILLMNMHVSFFWTPKTKRSGGQQHELHDKERWGACCYWSPWETIFNLLLISDLCNHEQLRVSLWYLYEIYHFWLFCPSYIIYQVHTAVLANQIKCKKLSKIFITSSLTARFTKLKISMRPLSLKGWREWKVLSVIFWQYNLLSVK